MPKLAAYSDLLGTGGYPGFSSISIVGATSIAETGSAQDLTTSFSTFTGSNPVTITVKSDLDVVPLPPTAYLLGSGLIGLAVARLRKRWGA